MAGADQVIRQPVNRGKGAAVRAGVLAAQGRTIAFTDAELSYSPDQLIGIEPVRQRAISAEKLAVNAVMAGCLPMHFPVVVAAFTAISASSVALPVLAYAVAGERLDEPLTKLKNWMEEQHAVLVAGILVIIGLMVLYKGIHAL